MNLAKQIIFLSIVLIVGSSYAQNTDKVLKLLVTDHPGEQLNIKFKPSKTFSDSLELVRSVNELVQTMRAKSYLLACIDSVAWFGDTANYYIHQGAQYSWSNLNPGNVNESILRRVGYSDRFFRKKKFKNEVVTSLFEDLITFSERSGHPFASVQLDSVEIKEGLVGATINFVPGPFIENDSINLQGTSTIKKKFLSSYIHYSKGDAFNQRNIDLIKSRLKKLKFVKMIGEPQLSFSNGKSVLYLKLDHKKSSRFNGILGILPNNTTDRRVLITGELNLDLLNPFGSGKQIKAEWKKVQPQTQQLFMLYRHPDFLRTGAEVTADLQLLKQDSAFINVERRLNVGYPIGRGQVGFFSKLRTSRLLSAAQYDSLTSPPYLDSDYWSYGVQYRWDNLDDPFFPRRGWQTELEASLGSKSILDNTQVHDSHYSTVEEKSVQGYVFIQASKYTRLGKQTVLLLKLQSGSIQNKNLFLNDMFRVGGLNSLRGFNENNFFASGYGVMTTEFRLYSDESSYLLLFYDQSYLVSNLAGMVSEDKPFGVGAGISFATANGNFNFIYSLGQSKSEKLSLSRSLIHFGLVSNF